MYKTILFEPKDASFIKNALLGLLSNNTVIIEDL